MKLFNNLPSEIRECIGTSDFKTEVELYYKNKCQHRIGKPEARCSHCVERNRLRRPLKLDYIGKSLAMDPVSFAGYRADARNNEDIGNIIINVKKDVIASIQKDNVWKSLVKVEDHAWETFRSKDNYKSSKVKESRDI